MRTIEIEDNTIVVTCTCFTCKRNNGEEIKGEKRSVEKTRGNQEDNPKEEDDPKNGAEDPDPGAQATGRVSQSFFEGDQTTQDP